MKKRCGHSSLPTSTVLGAVAAGVIVLLLFSKKRTPIDTVAGLPANEGDRALPSETIGARSDEDRALHYEKLAADCARDAKKPHLKAQRELNLELAREYRTRASKVRKGEYG